MSLDWSLWTAETIAVSLDGLVSEVESRLSEFSEEHRENNQAVVRSLRARLPSSEEIRQRTRTRELVILAYALDVLGRREAAQGNIDDSFRLFQSAHELFRATNASIRLTKQMRQEVANALRAVISGEGEHARNGQTDAEQIAELCRQFVASAWGSIPPQVDLMLNESLLAEIERVRRSLEDDSLAHESFVRANAQGVLSLEIPARQEGILEWWKRAAEHVAPDAIELAPQRAASLSELLTQEIWDGLEKAVVAGDIETLGRVLEEAEDALERKIGRA